jgi:signal peptidase I
MDIHGDSMEPVLEDSDTVLIDKVKTKYYPLHVCCRRRYRGFCQIRGS